VIPELHRPVTVERLAEQAGEALEIVATAEECAAVAARMGIPGVLALTCRFELTRTQDGRPGEVVARGALRAELVRECVVTLDEFATRAVEHFQIRFVPAGLEREDDDFESDDEIPYAGIAIDLGEAAVEQLALALDPYPRKPGAVLPPEASEPDEGPFALLARLGNPGRGGNDPLD
jgi:hypothetical protein